MRRLTLALLASLFGFGAAAAPAQTGRPEPLWPNGAPGAVGSEPADIPTIQIYKAPADRATGAAFVICPGGGYGGLADDHEGHQIARWMNGMGITGVILRYRHAPRYKHPAPMLDVQRAVRTVRSRAKELGIDPAKVGIMGFSAGGHLASTAITHFDSGRSDAEDPVERESSRPDAAILCYPVISMKPEVTHMGSRSNLLGAAPSAELETLMSNELQVTPQTPPAFLFHTTDDAVVKVENALLFYGALVKNRVPCEMHIYEKGRHGVGLAWDDPILSSWPARAADWLRRKGFTR